MCKHNKYIVLYACNGWASGGYDDVTILFDSEVNDFVAREQYQLFNKMIFH